MIFYLKNHSSQVLHSCDFAELLQLPPRPNFPNKQAFLDWSHADETEHCYYSLAEPKDPNRRLSKENPVAFVHGIVADFDSQLDRALLLKMIAKTPADYPAAYCSKTFSGGARVVWLFEKKLPMFDGDIAKKVLTQLIKQMKLTKNFAGYDEKSIDPSMVFELGTDWQALNPDARISNKILSTLVFEASRKADVSSFGPEIPMETIAAEVERKFPGRWRGPFAPGSQGCRFWSDGADNDTGAWIRETGVYAFTGEGRFLPWGEILGQEFVRGFEMNRIGGAIQNLYYDGRNYWCVKQSNEGNTQWVDLNTEVLKRKLAAAGLRREMRRGEPMSEIDRALSTIESNARVDGAFPFLYRGEETVWAVGRRYLNVSRITVVQPDGGRHAWGEGFEWTAGYLEQIFDPEQLAVFLAWFAHFYASAVKRDLRKGHALFIAGPAGIGKTFLSQRVIGDLMGGSAEATNYLLGKTEFNSEMYESPCWCIDDGVANADGRGHEMFSQIVKKVVANYTMTYRRMYQNPVTLPWEGRVVVTLNDDPDSISMLPNIDQSILDKVCFFKARQTKVDFKGAQEQVKLELPFLGAFLRDYQPPADLVGDFRYGVKSYHHPALLLTAKQTSNSSALLDLLTIWRQKYFAQYEGKFWEGSPTELMMEFADTDTLRSIAHKTVSNTNYLGRMLNKIILQEAADWLTPLPRTSGGARYKITRP